MPRKKEKKKGIFNFLNKNVKDFNKIVLSLGCISFLLLMGFISYKINNSYAYFTNDVKGSKLIEMTYTKPSLDKSGANAPELTNAMIPVYYDETNNVWKKADKSNSKEKYKWYDYDKKMWANAVTVESSSLGDSITKNKSVSLSNTSIPVKTYSTFTSGGYNINNADSRIKIIVKINTAGTFGFKATVSSESNYDKLTVTVSKNGGSATTVANAISGENSNTYSDTASVDDVYVITASYTKDSSANNGNDNGVLDSFTFPSNTKVSFTTSSEAGGTSGQDWTSEGGYSGGTGVLVGDSITPNDSTGKYDLNNSSIQTISSSLVGKYVCSTRTTSSCETAYKIVEASSTITKVDEYKAEVISRSDYAKAVAGTTIPMDAINTMWVWIPRYTYTYLNTNTPEEIQIKFEKGTNSSGTISCSDAINQTNSDGKTISEICTDTTNNGLVAGTSTYTHPAFWWDKNDDSIRDKDEELTGIWVGKFEVSSDTACAAGTSATVGENCNLTTIRPKIVPNVTSWTGAMVGTFFNGIYNMRESGNQYGFKTTDETHMMKNMEWGAVAYLYHSKYGRCTDGKCEKIGINNCSKHITGIGNYAGTSESDDTCTNSENQYNNTRGMLASTTGNVYGIYDMSGGDEDYVMGNGVNSDGKPISGISNDSDHENSGFTGYLTGYLTGSTLTGTYEFPSKRYYNQYSYVKGSSSSTAYDRGKLGDATKEMNPSSGGWYGNYSIFPTNWFYRGGSSTGEGLTGIFSFGNQYGKIESGWAYNGASSRAVISNLK